MPHRPMPYRPMAGLLGSAASVGLVYWAGFGSRSQVFGSFPYRSETTEKALALTFDDGPNEPYTSRLLDTLDDRGVPATFFQVGRCAERFPAATRRVVSSGHVLANHSFSHRARRYLSDPGQRQEIEQGQRALAAVSGVAPALYRPPWLCHWPWVLSSVAAARLQVVSGTFAHPLEVFQPPAGWLTAGAVRGAHPGAMLILHDGREARGGNRQQTVAAVGPLIDVLRERGYAFTTVDRLLGVPAYL